jgi:hypothetical protein
MRKLDAKAAAILAAAEAEEARAIATYTGAAPPGETTTGPTADAAQTERDAAQPGVDAAQAERDAAQRATDEERRSKDGGA